MNLGPRHTGVRGIVTSLTLFFLFVGGVVAADDANVRIAGLIPGPPACQVDNSNPATAAYLRGLQQAGYGNAELSQYCYSTLTDIPTRIGQILASKPNILLIWASATAARAVKDAGVTLPVVFVDIDDPVKFGLVESLAHPSTNMTGITNITDELVAKRIEILKEAFPRLLRLAVIGNFKNPDQLEYLRMVQQAARSVRIETRTYAVETQLQLAPAFAAMDADGMQAVMQLPDAWFYPNRAEVVALSIAHRIPGIYGNTSYADLGGVLTYGANLSYMNAKAAEYVGKILKGAKPGDLPVERPAKFDFIVNQKTAREMGLAVSPETLVRATQVIN